MLLSYSTGHTNPERRRSEVQVLRGGCVRVKKEEDINVRREACENGG